MVKVAKFGGSSLSCASGFENVKEIIRSDADRKIIVVSALGKRHSSDAKITDLLINVCFCAKNGTNYKKEEDEIKSRYIETARSLGVRLNESADFSFLKDVSRLSCAYVVSRGEYLSAKIAAEYFGCSFVDAADVVRFDSNGNVDYTVSEKLFSQKVSGYPLVIPGFYGAFPNGEIKLFARGGGDVTGAVLARLVKADLYENWTDVPGVMKADPKIVPDAEVIPYLSYEQLRLLSSSGAGVMQEDAILPVKKAGISINVRGVKTPFCAGTVVSSQRKSAEKGVYGITGKRGVSVIRTVKHSDARRETALADIMRVLEKHGVRIEIVRAGEDAVTVIAAPSERRAEAVVDELRRLPVFFGVFYRDDLSLVTALGAGAKDVSSILNALEEKNVSVRFIDTSPSGERFTVAVDVSDYERALRAAYGAV
ncbi:MAG: aspartate kinase [Clostridia bacterium]|nr:aspartate kinase [Clostridia bacterium]